MTKKKTKKKTTKKLADVTEKVVRVNSPALKDRLLEDIPLPTIPSQEEIDDLEQTAIEPAISGVTVQELEKMIQEYHQQKADVEEADAVTERLKKLKVNTERRLLAFMNEFDKSSYKSSWGTLVKTGRYSYRTPKTPETREKFFGYLKERGVFDGLISVNANTLASFAKEEMKAATERQDIDFAIPGLDEPTYTERVSLRKR